MTRFNMFTDDELDMMEEAFCYDRLTHLIVEIRMERRHRENINKGKSEDKSCSNCKYWLLDGNDENRKCKYCFEMDEWVSESGE